MSEHFQVRPFKESDRAFLFASWLNTYKASGYPARRIKNNIFYAQHHRAIERILSRPTTKVLIAHMVAEIDVIFGYLVTEFTDEFIVHYAFTKEPFRRSGIQKALAIAAKLPSRYLSSHWTREVDWLLSAQDKVQFDPYRI